MHLPEVAVLLVMKQKKLSPQRREVVRQVEFSRPEPLGRHAKSVSLTGLQT
jgi:hypothetical protein